MVKGPIMVPGRLGPIFIPGAQLKNWYMDSITEAVPTEKPNREKQFDPKSRRGTVGGPWGLFTEASSASGDSKAFGAVRCEVSQDPGEGAEAEGAARGAQARCAAVFPWPGLDFG